MNQNCYIFFQITLKFVLKDPIEYVSIGSDNYSETTVIAFTDAYMGYSATMS